MLITIASYVAASVIPFGLYWGYSKYMYRNVPKLILNPEKDDVDVPFGISVVDYELPPESEDEYLKRLATIHPKAWKSYNEDYANKRLLEDKDRFVSMLLLKYRNGEVTVEQESCTMNFSDGTELWTANEYYSFGYIWRSKIPGMSYSGVGMGRLSAYTFMSIVDLHKELSDFPFWKEQHDQYTRKRLVRSKRA